MSKPNTRLVDITDLTDDLVADLDRLFPEKCPDPADTERAIWMYAGTRALVRKLRTIREQQRNSSVEHFDA